MPSKIVDCPVCGIAMQKRIVRDGIEIDFCDWHGVWLDAGELERLHAMQGTVPTAKQPDVGKALSQGLEWHRRLGHWFLSGRPVGRRNF